MGAKVKLLSWAAVDLETNMWEPLGGRGLLKGGCVRKEVFEEGYLRGRLFGGVV